MRALTILSAAALLAGAALFSPASAQPVPGGQDVCNPVIHQEVGADPTVDREGRNAVIDSEGRFVQHNDSYPCPPEEEGAVISISADVLFDFDKSDIRPDAEPILNDVADSIIAGLNAENEIPDLLIVGHTDSIGTEEYNQGLSERRAESVSNYLMGRGVPGSEIASVTGRGELDPVASNATPEGRQLNRRVEIFTAGNEPTS